MEAIGKEIHAFRPHLKESTIKAYVSALKKLQKRFETDSFDFLDDPESVKEKLTQGEKPLAYTTVRNIYTAVIIYLLAVNHDASKDKVIQTYKGWQDEYNTQYQDQNKTGVISDKQSPNFITKGELESFIQDMKKDIKKDPQIYMVYTMFSILAEIPLRNDLAGLTLVSESKYEKLTDDDKKQRNYLVQDKAGPSVGFTLIDNIYKTSKKYGEKKIRISGKSPLAKILRAYIRHAVVLREGAVLFPITTNYLSQLLIKYSQKYIGKSISTTMIRKIISSDKFLDSKLEQEKHADMLGHSVGVENLVYIKKKQ